MVQLNEGAVVDAPSFMACDPAELEPLPLLLPPLGLLSLVFFEDMIFTMIEPVKLVLVMKMLVVVLWM